VRSERERCTMVATVVERRESEGGLPWLPGAAAPLWT